MPLSYLQLHSLGQISQDGSFSFGIWLLWDLVTTLVVCSSSDFSSGTPICGAHPTSPSVTIHFPISLKELHIKHHHTVHTSITSKSTINMNLLLEVSSQPVDWSSSSAHYPIDMKAEAIYKANS